MEITLNRKRLPESEVDSYVFGSYTGSGLLECNYGDKEISEIAQNFLSSYDFKGEIEDVCSFTTFLNGRLSRFIIVGLGEKEKLDIHGIRKSVNAAIKEAKKIKSKKVKFYTIGNTSKIKESDIVRIITEISILSMYKFDLYKSEKKKDSIIKIIISCAGPVSTELENSFSEGSVLGNVTVQARDLVNEPANVLTPVELAARTVKIGLESGFEVEVHDEVQIDKLGMKAYLEVARAADNKPRLIVMRYNGSPDKKSETIGLIGKGLTYDSGGLSIKTNDGMLTMKGDMGGAAAVICAISAIAKLKLKVNVVGVVAACENMISGKSYRPGDIIGSMAGKSIYIGSTDAEGRLTLADAVHYAIEKEGVDKVIDMATLTGSAIHATGYAADVVISNDDNLYSTLEKASHLSGEKVWRMPLFDEYKELLKSDIADLNNAAGKPGSITAGMFIGEFVQDKPWVHVDIAPSSWVDEDKFYFVKGGTGSGVRNLYFFVKELSK